MNAREPLLSGFVGASSSIARGNRARQAAGKKRKVVVIDNHYEDDEDDEEKKYEDDENDEDGGADFDPKAKQKENRDGQLAGLDSRGNPLQSRFTSAMERATLAAKAVRDVDWRDGPKPVHNSSQRRAAYVQQSGFLAPTGEACLKCRYRQGPFKSCRVLVVSGDLAFKGACGNCSFNSGGYCCTLRQGKLPEWVKTVLAAQNPGHPMLENPPLRTDPKRRGGRASEKVKTSNPSDLTTGQGKLTPATSVPGTAQTSPTAVKKQKDNPAGQPKAMDANKAARVGPWKNNWMRSPLGDPDVRDPNDFSVALAAFQAIPDMVSRLHSDRAILGSYLVSKGLIKPEDVPMKDEKKEEEKNPFLKYAAY